MSATDIDGRPLRISSADDQLPEVSMRVFVTGASGWIGRAVVPDLIAAGHEVTGLGRSDASAKALQDTGAEVRLGSLDDLGILHDAAASSDGVIHLAFKHDLAFTGDFVGAADADRQAIETFGEALAGTDKPFVIASGLLGLTPGRVATEHDGLIAETGDREAPVSGPEQRQANAQFTLALADRGVRSSIVRLPPTCHGNGDNGFMTTAIGFAREKGAAAYIGDGANRWPAVHRDDAARLFRLAIESAPGRRCTRSATKVSRSARSPRSSPHISGFPRSPSPPSRPGSTSAGWGASGDSTAPPRRRSPASCSGGSRPARD
jgi:nucleoside-diphosphate-sugar epimerase